MHRTWAGKTIAIALLVVLTFLTAMVCLCIGYYSLSISDIFAALLGGEVLDSNAQTIINIRLPRIGAALLIGGALSMSGAAYQGMFKNPLVSPDILGVSSGASAGAALAIFMGCNSITTQIYAFVGGFLAVGIAYLISLKSRLSPTLSLVLTGTMVGSLASAFVTALKYVANPSDTLADITFWLMGSLTKITYTHLSLALLPMVIGGGILLLYRWQLNLLSLSDSEAKSIGINPKRTKLIVIFAATLLSASAVCLGGVIGWVGLIIPHITRFLFGANYKYVVPASCVLGALFLLIMDTIARSLLMVEIPLGVMTAFAGTPFFLGLILFKRSYSH